MLIISVWRKVELSLSWKLTFVLIKPSMLVPDQFNWQVRCLSCVLFFHRPLCTHFALWFGLLVSPQQVMFTAEMLVFVSFWQFEEMMARWPLFLKASMLSLLIYLSVMAMILSCGSICVCMFWPIHRLISFFSFKHLLRGTFHSVL